MCKDSNHWCILSNKWSVEGMNTIGHNHTGCGLMVGVFILHLERSGSSDSHSKTRVIHVVLLIAVTWHEVNKPTPETPFFHLAKKKKKNTIGHKIPKYQIQKSFKIHHSIKA